MSDLTGQVPEAKVCGSCGETFGCGAKLDGCWCTGLEIPAAAADELKTIYADCLCLKCLISLSEFTAIVVKYPDGRTEIITAAVRVDTQNFHEGMIDFYDANGNLLRQIDMGSGISWEQMGPQHDN